MKLQKRLSAHLGATVTCWLVVGPVFGGTSMAGGETWNRHQAPTASTDLTDVESAVLAIVNGTQITTEEIDAAIQADLGNLRQQITQARRRELDLQINSFLLEAEAKTRGLSATDLLRTEVISKARTPTEAEAKAYFDRYQDQLEGDFEARKEEILAHLQFQREQQTAGKLAEQLRSQADVEIQTEEITPPEVPAERDRVFATVNGKEITSGDIEDSLKGLIARVEEQIYLRRQAALDLKINDLLLEAEARKRETTPEALLRSEVTSRMKPISESDARTFYEQNKDRINGDWAEEENRLRILEHLHQREAVRARVQFAAELREAAGVEVFLSAPEPPVFEIAVDDQPSKGNPNAPVTIVEFTDYQCPSCAQIQPVLEKLVADYGDRVRLVVRDFPLRSHPMAFRAAIAAEAAREQDRYWDYSRSLFDNQAELSEEKLKAHALALDLDTIRFDEALAGNRSVEKVQRDILDGDRLGVSSTPTIFVNGREIEEKTLVSLKAAVDSALKKKAALSGETGSPQALAEQGRR